MKMKNYSENFAQNEKVIKEIKPHNYRQLFDILHINEVWDQKNQNLKSICQTLGFVLLPATSLKDLRNFLTSQLKEWKVSKKLNVLEFCDFVEICELLNISINIDKNIIHDYFVELTNDKNQENFENWYENHILGLKTASQRVQEWEWMYIIRSFVWVAMWNFS